MTVITVIAIQRNGIPHFFLERMPPQETNSSVAKLAAAINEAALWLLLYPIHPPKRRRMAKAQINVIKEDLFMS
jgi:hypothetical protein